MGKMIKWVSLANEGTEGLVSAKRTYRKANNVLKIISYFTKVEKI